MPSTLLAAENINITSTVSVVLGIIGTILITVIGFFLAAFYKEVRQISTDVHQMQIAGARKEEEMNQIKERLGRIEKTLRNYQN